MTRAARNVSSINMSSVAGLIGKIRARDAVLALVLVAVVAFVFTDVAADRSAAFLDRVLLGGLVNLSAMMAVKSVISVLSSAKVSVSVGIGGELNVGSMLSPLSDVVDTGIQLFLISSGILAVFKVLLIVCKTVLFKGLLALSLLPATVKAARPVAVRIIVVLLLINPGLPAYLGLSELLYDHAIPETGESINKRFTNIKAELERIMATEGVWDRAKNLMSASGAIISESVKGVLDLLFIYFASVLILFVLLPVFYYYLMRTALRPLLAGRPSASVP